MSPYISTTPTTDVRMTCGKCGETYPGHGLGYHFCPESERLFGNNIRRAWRVFRGWWRHR